MNLTITGRKCTPRESFREHAEKKLKKMERFFGPEVEAKVKATVEKSSQTVELTVMHAGTIFRAQESAENMNEALDKCVDTLIRKIRKSKTKIERRLREGSFDSFAQAEPVEEEVEYDVVRKKTVPLKPQSVDEAILQMNLLDHPFYMFRNVDTEEVCVVYQRKSGGYGLIVPEN